jgi:ABC-2 type transport system permease protein
MRTFAAAFRLQLRVMRADPDYLMPLATIPLFTIVFLAIVRNAGREDLTEYALMAPVLIALWQLSLTVAGEIVADDRWLGTLEVLVAAPASFPLTVVARVFAVTSVSFIAFGEVWAVAAGIFRVNVVFHHPTAFGLTLAATALAMSGTALIMAALFVVTRTARTFQNSLSYPFYVLGGVLVPVSFLPNWIEPLSKAVFLSWSADLLRDGLRPAPVDDFGFRLGMVLGLGVVGFVVGRLVLERILRRVRTTGEIGLA